MINGAEPDPIPLLRYDKLDTRWVQEVCGAGLNALPQT